MGVANYQDYNRVLGSLMRGRVSGRIAKAIRAQVSLLAASPAFKEGTNVDYKRAADDAASVLDLIGGVGGLSKKVILGMLRERKSTSCSLVHVLRKSSGVVIRLMVQMIGTSV